MAAGNTHILPDFVRDVALGNQLADVTMLSFRDPNSFFAGNLHNHLDFWRSLAALSPYDQATTVLNWIENRVNVFDFFQHFKGHYKGMFFDSDIPPPMILRMRFLVRCIQDLYTTPYWIVLLREPFPFGVELMK